MIKFSKIIIIFFVFLNNCSYEPILKKKNINFAIKIENLEGNKEINSILENRFINYASGDKRYNISKINLTQLET